MTGLLGMPIIFGGLPFFRDSCPAGTQSPLKAINHQGEMPGHFPPGIPLPCLHQGVDQFLEEAALRHKVGEHIKGGAGR